MPLVLPRHLRPKRDKIFGPAPSHRLDGNAKARLWATAAAYNSANRQARQHQGPLTWASLRVLRVLLWRFHSADGGGRCFPSYEKIAVAAQCCRDSVCVAITALENAGLLTWVHRLTRIRRREQDLFGHWGSVWQVIRTSNGYRLLDPFSDANRSLVVIVRCQVISGMYAHAARRQLSLLAFIAEVIISHRMTPYDFARFRARMGWDRAEMARQLDLSVSRIADYELGRTRGKNPQPAPIPKVVELACRYLGGERAPLSKEEWIARLRDTSHLPRRKKPLAAAALDRERLYADRA